MFVVKVNASSEVEELRTVPDGKELRASWFEITAEQATTLRAATLHLDGSSLPRWSYDVVTKELTENTDGRVTASWSRTTVNARVGDAEPALTLTLSDLSINRNQIVQFEAVGPLRLSFVNGVADVAVSTAEAAVVRLRHCADFRMTNALMVRVLDNKIRPRQKA